MPLAKFPNEFSLIRRFQKQLGTLSKKNAVVGIGDDCAVFKEAKAYSLLTHDLLLEKVHFLPGTNADFEDLGYKSMAVNLSDIAAMGGTARAAVVGLGIPKTAKLSQLESFYRGLKACAARYSCGIVGGDTNASKQGWVIAISALGYSAKPPLLRKGARIGDLLYVTGTLGTALLGWEAIQGKDRSALTLPFRRQHARPSPRLEWGREFLQSGLVTAMIDVSDGLAGDLKHLAEDSGVGFEVELSQIPRHPAFDRVCRRLGRVPMDILIGGGEDYELLFTVQRGREGLFQKILKQKKIAATCIGKAVPGAKLSFFSEGRGIRRKIESFRHF